MKGFSVAAALVCVALFCAGCSTPTITNTARNAVEQMLTDSVIERAIDKLPLEKFSGKKFVMDYTHLNPQVDKDVVQGYLEHALARNGIIVVSDAASADIAMQVTSGILATDQSKLLLGTPEIPVPLPVFSITVVVPEIALFLRMSRTGCGRFFFTLRDAKTLQTVASFGGIDAEAFYTNWSVMFFPFKTHNVTFHDEKPAGTRTVYFWQE